jgi:trimethylamine--corrinoid protein Co-methyltransferase
MRPTVRFLSVDLIEQIVAEARELLAAVGVQIHNPRILAMLSDHGARVDAEKHRAFLPETLVERALRTVPRSFCLYDVHGRLTHEFAAEKVYFTPGSAAINVLDPQSGHIRSATTADYLRYVRVVAQLPHLASQSTALVPSDVPAEISDSYRLLLSLLFCEKPVITGAFTIESFAVMQDLQLAVRGSAEALKERPLSVFSCCPTAPLSWSEATSQNLVDCAKSCIPVELIAMPLSGFVAPVTLVGTLIQHTAETLSGLVISQLASPGAPVLYGGSPAIFDMRYETTPMGAVETMMLDCAYSEIGKYLGLPTQAYIGLSDSKQLDAQAGLESAMGVTLAVLAGINNVAGPGMLDFESCFSIEKLVLDNEVCGMALRLARGIVPQQDFPALPHFEELIRRGHLLISAHTRKYLRSEHYVPGPVIDRANRARWSQEGARSLLQRAQEQVERLLSSYRPPDLPASVRTDLEQRMLHEARRCGMQTLPHMQEPACGTG